MGWIETIFASIFLFILPGWALLSFLGKDAHLEFAEKIGLSTGLSISLYPVLFYFCSILKVAPGRLMAWIPGIAAIIYLGAQILHKTKHKHTWSSKSISFLFLLLAGLMFFTRMIIIRDMVAPAWGDSVQHTIIVRLMLDHGGLFQSWAPYAPLETFTYHFGFHAAGSVLVWLTGASTSQAVLICGQILNLLAILALYPLARRLAGSSICGLGAMLTAGLLFPLPAYFVNWGRYTQLAGQVILPVAIWLILRLLDKKKRATLGLLALTTLTILALGLTHYRVAVLLFTAIVAFALYGLWVFRQDIKLGLKRFGFLTVSGIAGIILYIPWVLNFSDSRLPIIFGRSAGSIPKTDYVGDLHLWGMTDFYFHDIFGISAAIALIIAFRKRSVLAAYVGLWYSLSFILANPRLFRLPGEGFLTNEYILFSIYIPIGLLLGWLIGFVWKVSTKYKLGKIFAYVGFIVMLIIGTNIQLKIVDPYFQMVMPEDLESFQWIRSNTPKDASFLVNGFLMFNKTVVVGSDAGWWLPYYTQRKNNIPPILHTTEKLSPSKSREGLNQIISDIRNSQGNPDLLRPVLQREGITYIFLGEKRGRVGYDQEPLLSEQWLTNSPDFTLLYQAGSSQVWKFNAKERKND